MRIDDVKPIASWSIAVFLLGCPMSVRAQDWHRTKEQLAKHGATVTVVYGGVFSELNGGVRPWDTYSGNLNLQLSIDGERLFGRSGLTMFADGLWIHGGQPSGLLGDAQGVSNLSAPSTITGFGESGFCDGRVNRFNRFLGVGVVASGSLATRPTDEVGLAPAIAHNGSGFLAHQRRVGVRVNGSETAVELTYLAQIANWLAVQPDFQFVIHPNTHPLARNGRALQLRFETTF
jgi:carbohydrate-selective porin OprB